MSSMIDDDLTITSTGCLIWPFPNSMNDTISISSACIPSSISSASISSASIPSSIFSIDQSIDQSHDLQVSGNSDFKGNVTVNGNLKIGNVDLGERLDKIEQRLAILRPNIEIESRWEQLKQLGEQYRQLERELIERDWIFEQLKK
jgi:hypothetical protein